MKLRYFPGSDSLCIDFNAQTSADSKEIADGLVVDFDQAGNVVGIDIQDASRNLDLQTIETEALSAPQPRLRMRQRARTGASRRGA